jgi:uncharacterized iron-regulated protein
MAKRFLLSVFLLFISSCAVLPKHYVRLDSGTDISFEEVLRQIENERLIFVGEIHDDSGSHRVQSEVIRHLHENGRDIVIAIEIIPNSRQGMLDRWVEGNVSRYDFARFFYNTVHVPYRYYKDIFEYAREMKIPVVGIDSDTKLISDVSKKGFNTAPGDFLEKIKFSDCSGDPEYARLLGFSAVQQYHESGLPFLCDGQRMRDAVIAFNIAAILKRGNATVVVLTGTAHAMKLAVPRQIKKHVTVSHKVLVPGSIRFMINRRLGPDMADYAWY